jgi:transcriptional regulator with XRE-family HTH domain
MVGEGGVDFWVGGSILNDSYFFFGGEVSEVDKKIRTKAPVIGRYERDKVKPSIETAARLASLLEISLDYLVGNSDIEVNAYMLNRVLELQTLSEEDKNTALKLLDAFLIDAKTNQAFSKQKWPLMRGS